MTSKFFLTSKMFLTSKDCLTSDLFFVKIGKGDCRVVSVRLKCRKRLAAVQPIGSSAYENPLSIMMACNKGLDTGKGRKVDWFDTDREWKVLSRRGNIQYCYQDDSNHRFQNRCRCLHFQCFSENHWRQKKEKLGRLTNDDGHKTEIQPILPQLRMPLAIICFQFQLASSASSSFGKPKPGLTCW